MDQKENCHLLNPRGREKRVCRGQDRTDRSSGTLPPPLSPSVPPPNPSNPPPSLPSLFLLPPSLCHPHPPPITPTDKCPDLQCPQQARGEKPKVVPWKKKTKKEGRNCCGSHTQELALSPRSGLAGRPPGSGILSASSNQQPVTTRLKTGGENKGRKQEEKQVWE